MKKYIAVIIVLVCSLAAYGQQMTLSEWNEEAQTNIRLLPKYGHMPKNEGQKNADKKFIDTMLKQFPTYRTASNNSIRLGFQYLYKNAKTAMYRFNQAYLLDSTNADIYWGYGAVYMVLGDLENAEKQYLEGLALAPENTHLLTDYGTYFMSQYYMVEPVDEKNANAHLATAIKYMAKSYALDNSDPNTAFKLSVCYFLQNDCKNAREYYAKCKSLGGQPITEDFTKALDALCKKQ